MKRRSGGVSTGRRHDHEVARLTPLASIANFILVVEDDEDEATFLKELLEKHKYRVTVARDGGQAQATFVMGKPDFVILDLILPGESGFEVCQRLKQANSTVPVLVLTAVDMPEARVLAERVGSDGFLTKPFDPEELLRQIQGIACGIGRRRTATKERTRSGSGFPAAAASGSKSVRSIGARP